MNSSPTVVTGNGNAPNEELCVDVTSTDAAAATPD